MTEEVAAAGRTVDGRMAWETRVREAARGAVVARRLSIVDGVVRLCG